jgi:hypothetical protein
MAGTQQENLDLRWQALLVAVPPFLVYLFNDQLLAHFGTLSGPAPAIASRPAGLPESGARLQYLAALLVFAGIAAAVMAAFFLTLRILASETRRRMIWGAVALSIVAAIALNPHLPGGDSLHTPGIPSDIGLPDTCPPQVSRPDECAVPHYATMVSLLEVWKWVLMTATAALIFGIICCMAGAPQASAERIKAAALKQQAKRLNLFLCLAAMLMVSALLVQLAFLRWPRFSMQVPDLAHFDAYVSAVLLYYGVGYSVFLASFYVPAVCSLGWRADKLTNRKLRAEVLEGVATGPVYLLQQAATIIAPALTALLTASIGLLG